MDNKIDTLDRKILSIITRNARIPFKDVAEKCDVSRAAIHQRVQRLIDMGVITGSGYTVDAGELNYKTCTYIGIYLEKGWMYEEVVEELGRIDEIVECHYTTGQYSIFAKIYAIDNEDLKRVLNEKVQAIRGISSTETFISLEQRFKREIPIYF